MPTVNPIPTPARPKAAPSESISFERWFFDIKSTEAWLRILTPFKTPPFKSISANLL